MATCFIRYLSLLNVWWVPFQVSWGKLVIVSTDKELITKGGRKCETTHRNTDCLISRCRERVETIRQDQTAIRSGNPPGWAKRRKVGFKQKIHNNISRSNETWQTGHFENRVRMKEMERVIFSHISLRSDLCQQLTKAVGHMLTCPCYHFTICTHVSLYTKQHWGLMGMSGFPWIWWNDVYSTTSISW